MLQHARSATPRCASFRSRCPAHRAGARPVHAASQYILAAAVGARPSRVARNHRPPLDLPAWPRAALRRCTRPRRMPRRQRRASGGLPVGRHVGAGALRLALGSGTVTCRRRKARTGPMLANTVGAQVGVSSFGMGCARKDVFGVYTRVASFSRWIVAQHSKLACNRDWQSSVAFDVCLKADVGISSYTSFAHASSRPSAVAYSLLAGALVACSHRLYASPVR